MPAGKHREGYRKPGTGQRRRQNKPLRGDRLAPEVKERVQAMRAGGATWEEIAEASGLPTTTLRRWYDLRVEQVRDEVLEKSARARALAEAFTRRGFRELPEATLNALSTHVFALMEAGTPAAQEKSLSGLLFLLTKLMNAQTAQQRATLEKEKVALARRKCDAIKKTTEGAKARVAKRKLSPSEMKKVLDEIYGLAS